jgi:hypothetical protein
MGQSSRICRHCCPRSHSFRRWHWKWSAEICPRAWTLHVSHSSLKVTKYRSVQQQSLRIQLRSQYLCVSAGTTTAIPISPTVSLDFTIISTSIMKRFVKRKSRSIKSPETLKRKADLLLIVSGMSRRIDFSTCYQFYSRFAHAH